jgi:NAD(P)-dependent dehydrogenase (short-subunit alcohol dehydrogenase family)
MTEALRFDGKAFVITGAGRGIGRSYAQLLASRGAAILINDLGTSVQGSGMDESLARQVAAEIVADGGRAVGNSADVTDPAGATVIVEECLSAFGRVDGVINSAGIITSAAFPEVESGELFTLWNLHVVGSFNVTRAAWGELGKRSGSVVMTSSAGIFGAPFAAAYNTAKAGVFGLMRSVAAVGREAGVRVNAVMPSADTRMQLMPGGQLISDEANDAEPVGGPSPLSASDLAAPLVAFLMHDSCGVTGEMFFTGRGHAARVFLGTGPGHFDADMSIESVAGNWGRIMRTDGFFISSDVLEHREQLMSLHDG